MAERRRFGPQLRPGANSRPIERAISGELPADVQRFKNTYVHERRFLERFRLGSSVLPYHPASSLDGKSRFDTPEEKDGENQWKAVYKKLVKAQEFNPTHFVRILFKVLRGSSLSVPTLKQLASPGVLELVTAHQQELKFTLMEEFVAESQRARSSVTISQKGVGHPLSLSVYYAIVDSRLELSPLFKYCLATMTSRQLRQIGEADSHCEKLDLLAKQFEFMAAMDYTLFPDLYDSIWGPMIPSGFRVAASSLLETCIEQ